jgi:hypothetical protein
MGRRSGHIRPRTSAWGSSGKSGMTLNFRSAKAPGVSGATGARSSSSSPPTGAPTLRTLQERKSRLTLAQRLLGKDADLTAKTIAGELGGLPARARRTITYDNGGEFARHEVVTDAIGLAAYFCDPHSPWRRGSIENCPQGYPRRPRRCRHRRLHLESQSHDSEVPRLPHPMAGKPDLIDTVARIGLRCFTQTAPCNEQGRRRELQG